uniref:Uncharacterized protein n=1 Tax=Oryza rufipogon TaxID=4529 RepID=A0A0E0QRW1_ORYRU
MPPKYLAEMLSPPPRHLYKSTPLYLLPTRKEKREATRHCTHHHLLPRDRHGAPRPALGRHGGRAAAGLRPRQAPQVRLLLPFLLLLDDGGVAVAHLGGGGCGRRAGRDAQHHHPPPAGAVRDVAARQRVGPLHAVVAGQRPGLPLRLRW